MQDGITVESPENVYDLKTELFHIVHSAIWHINEKREAENKIIILDKEIWYSIQKIKLDQIIFFSNAKQFPRT